MGVLARWQSEIPVGETEESQRAKQEILKARFKENDGSEKISKDVSNDMLSVYSTVRKDINDNDICKLC